MASPRGARMPTMTARGKKVDENIYFAKFDGIKNRFAAVGWDVNSIVADPLFVDPAKGDFRVKDDSPALELGFKNFPMDQFGVKKPSLKAIAATPILPELKVIEKLGRLRGDSPKYKEAFPVYWLSLIHI